MGEHSLFAELAAAGMWPRLVVLFACVAIVVALARGRARILGVAGLAAWLTGQLVLPVAMHLTGGLFYNPWAMPAIDSLGTLLHVVGLALVVAAVLSRATGPLVASRREDR